MTQVEFENYCKKMVAEWYNKNTVEPAKDISTDDVFMTWFCKTADKKKGLFGTNAENDHHYFEFTQINEDLIVMDVYLYVDKRDLNPKVDTSIFGDPTIFRE